MKCSICGSDNNDGEKFCLHCGAKLEAQAENENYQENNTATENTVNKEISADSEAACNESSENSSGVADAFAQAYHNETTRHNLNTESDEAGKPKNSATNPDKSEEVTAEVVSTEENDSAGNIATVSLKRVAIGAACALVLICLLSLVVAFVNGMGDEKHSITLFSNSDSVVSAFYDGKQVGGEFKGVVEGKDTSVNGNAMAVMTTDKALYSVAKNGIVKVCENEVKIASVSSNGKGIMYNDMDGRLYLYDIKSGKTVKISDDADMNEAEISPDGKTVAYTKKNDNTLYLYNDGETGKIDENIKCIAIADRARYVYGYSYLAEPEKPLNKPQKSDFESYDDYKKAYDEYKNQLEQYEKEYKEYAKKASDFKSKLYVYKDGKKKNRNVLLSEYDNSEGYSIELNNNFSEIVFCSDDKTYYAENGGKSKKILNRPAMMLDMNVPTKLYGTSAISCGCDNLLGRLFTSYSGGLYYYIDENGRKNEIDCDDEIDTCEKFGDNIYYLADEKLYMAEGKDCDESRRIARYVDSFSVSNDGKTVYYIDDDGVLFMVNDGKDEVEIAEDVNEFQVSPNGGVYYTKDYSRKRLTSTLYFAKDKKSEKISSEVSFFKVEPKMVYYGTNVKSSKIKTTLVNESDDGHKGKPFETEINVNFATIHISSDCNADFDVKIKKSANTNSIISDENSNGYGNDDFGENEFGDEYGDDFGENEFGDENGDDFGNDFGDENNGGNIPDYGENQGL